MWSAYLIQTTTGRIGPKVDLAPGTSWQIHLNDIESFSANLQKSSLPEVDVNTWLAPWWGGILWEWNGQPIFAGPFTARPIESFKTVSVQAGGIRAVFAHRYVLQEQTDWSKLASSVIFYDGLGLGTIAKRAVSVSMAKPAGALPIDFVVPDEIIPGDALHQRTYSGFDIQNLLTTDVLTKLSNVHNGPDIMFKPRKLSDSQLVWDLWTGTEANPRIYQTNTAVWDTTATQSSVTDLQVVTSGAYQTDRVFGVGAGTGAGTLVSMVQDPTQGAKGFPLLESSVTVGSETNLSVVTSNAQGSLDQNLKMLHDINLTVRADGEPQFGTYWSGDAVKLITKGWLALPDGVNNCRLITMSGSESNDILLSLQLES